MAGPLLECAGLTRRFGERTAVDELSFTIAPGETYGLLGPNGSGKTTTISMIAGILRPDGGTVTIDGQPITTSSGATKSKVGLVPQEIALYEDLTVVENLRFFGRLHGLGGSALDARIGVVLDVVGLADRRDDRVGDYSGGMKRRANIAVGLLHEPLLLILDEPTVGVDPQSRHQILEAIATLGRSGMAVLYTTHYMEEAEQLCDRIGILDQGHLIAEGSRSELIATVGEHDLIVLHVADADAQRLERVRHEIDALGSVERLSTELETPADPGSADPETADPATNDTAPAGDEATTSGRATVTVTTTDADATLAAVVAAANRADLSIMSLAVREPNLEAVFLELTGKALRD